jgi:hypothetical protein
METTTMRETWYVLEDGTPVHPSEVAPNDKGRLTHKLGLVAMRDDGETPRSRGVDVDERKPFGGKGDHDDNGKTGGAKKTVEMMPEPASAPKAKPGYKTRKAK